MIKHFTSHPKVLAAMGNDISISTRLDDTWTTGPSLKTWVRKSTPRPMTCFSIFPLRVVCYFSGGDSENFDIYRVKMPSQKPRTNHGCEGKLIDGKTENQLAEIIYERLPDGKEIGSTYSNPETGSMNHIPGVTNMDSGQKQRSHFGKSKP